MAGAAAGDFAQDGVNAPCPGDVFDVVAARRADLAEVRGLFAQGVDSLERERHAGLVGDRQDVKHGVGASPHRHVEDHRVVEGGRRGDLAASRPWPGPFLANSLAIATIRWAARS